VFTKTAYDTYRGQCFVGYPQPYVMVRRITDASHLSQSASDTAPIQPENWEDLSEKDQDLWMQTHAYWLSKEGICLACSAPIALEDSYCLACESFLIEAHESRSHHI